LDLATQIGSVHTPSVGLISNGMANDVSLCREPMSRR
jgi:hypothetical protein